MARKITAKMEAFIDGKIKNHGAAQLAIKNALATNVMAEKLIYARELLGYVAESCVGIIEQGGNNKGLYVVEIQKTVDNSASQEPWCMAAVQTWIAYVEKKLGVKSPIVSSEHCMTTWRNTPLSQRVKAIPAAWAIIIWKNGSTDSGHTGLVKAYPSTGKKMTTVEGNTGSGSMFDGDGIYSRARSKDKDGSLKIQGFLKPF